MLQRRITSGAIANAVFLSIRAEILPGPVDLVVSKLESSHLPSIVERHGTLQEGQEAHHLQTRV